MNSCSSSLCHSRVNCSSSLYMAELYFVAYRHQNLFLCSPIHGNLGDFRFMDTTNKYEHSHKSLQKDVSYHSSWVDVSGWEGWILQQLYLSPFKKLPNWLPKRMVPLTLPPEADEFRCSHSSAHTCYVVWSGLSTLATITHMLGTSLWFPFLKTDEAEHFFRYLFATGRSSVKIFWLFIN